MAARGGWASRATARPLACLPGIDCCKPRPVHCCPLRTSLYQAAGDKAAHTRQRGLPAIQHGQGVPSAVRRHGQIRRAEVMTLCRLSGDQAKKLLLRLRRQERLTRNGERRGSYYTLGPKA